MFSLERKRLAFVSLLLSFVCVISALSEGVINVHLVGHSHDDPGWLKTVDQYYTGHNASIYPAQVQYIFDSVIGELSRNEKRKFTFCEISFFSRWYREQDSDMRVLVKKLVKNGQLTFVNGGWVMHDEASAHYVSMVDQTTLGHRFLKEELDFLPTVGWQIDPFGHSNTHAWLSSEVGFDALYFGRIDYQDHNKRMAERTMEFVWKGSNSQPDAQVFTGVFHDGNYGPPSGFCFDTTCSYCRSDPAVADPLLSTYNIDQKVEQFIEAVYEEHSHSVGSNIMLKMGSDFAWDNARSWFKSLDLIMERVSKVDPRLNVFYSTPADYTKAKAAERIVWTSKTDDFFPYSDCEHCFWTGYFTSRPGLKAQERKSSQFLQSLKQVTTMSLLKDSKVLSVDEAKKVVFQLTAANGLVNHHDALTGTSKQHVADDYGRILALGMTQAEATVGSILGNSQTTPWATCRLLNETVCSSTQALVPGSQLFFTVYNPLARQTSQQIDLPINFPAGRVKTADGQTELKSAVLPTASYSPNSAAAPFVLTFAVDQLPALSSKSFIVEVLEDSNGNQMDIVTTRASISHTESDSEITVTSDLLTVSFDKATGLLKSVRRNDLGIAAEVSNDLGYYFSFGSNGLEATATPVDDRDPHLQNIKPAPHNVGATSSQQSGAYIFRPSKEDETPTMIREDGASAVNISVVVADGVAEVRQVFSSWAKQTVRIREGSNALELEFAVGPIPVDHVSGREVISKFQSNLNSGPVGANKVYTDSNGREFLERKYNYRPTWEMEVFEPVAGNYYPITAGMYIRDEDAKLQLSILPDRAQAGASLQPGSLEMMVHRRLTVDDNRGVGEPLDETVGGMSPYPNPMRSGEGMTFIGKHYLLLSDLQVGMKELRQKMDAIFAAPVVFYSTPTEAGATMPDAVHTPKGLSEELPINVQLMSFEYLEGAKDESKVLIRLAHQFAIGEDSELSKDVEIDLADIFANFGSIKSVTEMNLSANQLKSDMMKNKVVWQSDAMDMTVNMKPVVDESRSSRSLRSSSEQKAQAKVTLQAMEIKSLIVSFASR